VASRSGGYLGIGALAIPLIGLATFSQLSIGKTKAAVEEGLTYPQPQEMQSARTTVPARQAGDAPERRARKTDEPVLVAVPPANPKASAPHGDFEEF
jgi:hypothetical protein